MFDPSTQRHRSIFPPSLTYLSAFAAALVLGILVFETVAVVLGT